MSNRKKNLSGTGKEMLDSLCAQADIERTLALKLALAKGIAKGEFKEAPKDDKSKWTIPDGIIRDKEYTLFKHLIIEEQQKDLSDEEISDYMLLYIEAGLQEFHNLYNELSSLEDFKIKMLE